MLQLILAAVLAPASLASQAQTPTVYTIGVSGCGVGSTTWIDCYAMPVTHGTTTTTMWIEADYPPYTAEDFFVGSLGDYAVSDVQIKKITNVCWTSMGKHYCENLPQEITANLTGVEGTTASGSIDLKIAYTIGKTGRYTSGPLAATAGGTVTIN